MPDGRQEVIWERIQKSEKKETADLIARGEAILGIELGSTRIKGVLIDAKGKPLAAGSKSWENQLVNGVWTYDLDEVWAGIAACYSSLAQDVKKRYGVKITRVAAAGFSGMMHGYIALDKSGKLLSPFRTWRNNITGEAAEKLTKLFKFAIPQRWSIAHLYQSMLNKDAHVKNIAYLTTLAGYIHLKLTGNKVMGVGEASGMFPIDPDTLDYDQTMVKKIRRRADESRVLLQAERHHAQAYSGGRRSRSPERGRRQANRPRRGH